MTFNVQQSVLKKTTFRVQLANLMTSTDLNKYNSIWFSVCTKVAPFINNLHIE